MKHTAILDGPSLDDTYSWFCMETVKGNCRGEGFGFATSDEAAADAVAAGHPVATDDEIPGRYDGIPGLVWYAKVTKTLGRDLKLGEWLDSLDHRGARMIYGLSQPLPGLDGTGGDEPPLITVMFSLGDTEMVRADVEYDVVDPDSQVTPDGSPS